MFGFLLQWPTIVTGLMFPILTILYARPAISEERDSVKRFGIAYLQYAEHTPRFIPRVAADSRRYDIAPPLVRSKDGSRRPMDWLSAIWISIAALGFLVLTITRRVRLPRKAMGTAEGAPSRLG